MNDDSSISLVDLHLDYVLLPLDGSFAAMPTARALAERLGALPTSDRTANEESAKT